MAQTSNQVKFYAVNTLPASPDPYNLYFVNGGELYKGTQRFGLAKVIEKPTTGDNIPENPPTTDVARGDIAVGWGAAKVYNGSAWVDLGADSTITDDLTSRVEAIESHVIPGQNLISATTGSFTNLTVDGKTIQQIIASISESHAAGSSNGIEVSVTTSGGNVTNVTVNASAFANVMHFKGVVNLSSTTESLEGYDVGDIILIGSSANIGWYNIGTSEVPATGALVPGEKEGTGFTPATEGQEYICVEAQDGQFKWELIGDQNTGATKGYVDDAISSALTYTAPSSGVTSSANTLSGAVQALASAIDGAKTEISSPDSAFGDLVTASAVIGYVSGTRWNASDTAYPIGEGENRPSIAVEIDETAEKKVVVTTRNFGTAVGANVVTLAQGETFASKSSSSDLPTASQVYSFVTSQIGSITASSIILNAPGEDAEWEGPIGIAISSGTTVSNVQNAIEVLNAAIYDVSSTLDEVSAETVPYTPSEGAGVTTSASTVSEAITALDTAVASAIANISSINTSLSSLGAAAYKGVATSIGPSESIPAQGADPSVPAASNDNLATEKAVRDALNEVAQTIFWYEES